MGTTKTCVLSACGGSIKIICTACGKAGVHEATCKKCGEEVCYDCVFVYYMMNENGRVIGYWHCPKCAPSDAIRFKDEATAFNEWGHEHGSNRVTAKSKTRSLSFTREELLQAISELKPPLDQAGMLRLDRFQMGLGCFGNAPECSSRHVVVVKQGGVLEL